MVVPCKDSLCYQQALAVGAMAYLEKPVPRAEMDWIFKTTSKAHWRYVLPLRHVTNVTSDDRIKNQKFE